MARRGAKAAAAAVGKASTSMAEMVPASAVRNGVYVTLVFFMVYYVFLFSQAVMKRKLRAHYAAQGKKFDRYFSRDKSMLLWDRTVGNMLEQSVPFLTLFWLSVFLSNQGGFGWGYVVRAGWLYNSFRSLYPILWSLGGGTPEGTTRIIWKATVPMYLIIIFLAANVAYATVVRAA